MNNDQRLSKDLCLPTKSQVQGNVALSDRGGQGSLKSDGVLLDGVKSLIGNGGLAVLDDRGDADGLPLNGDLQKIDKSLIRNRKMHRIH